MRFAVAALVLLLLAGCAPGTDRASLQSRGDTLVAQLREVPGVLDAVVRDEKPGKNAAPMFVRVEYDLGAEGIAETLVAVRNTMSDSDFELFSLKAEVDDSQELPYGAEISWSGLPTFSGTHAMSQSPVPKMAPWSAVSSTPFAVTSAPAAFHCCTASSAAAPTALPAALE